jgi:hypothetical protein
MTENPSDPPRRPGTPSEDDLPPTGNEARAQGERPVTPLIWTALGIVAIGIFVIALILLHGASPIPSPWR